MRIRFSFWSALTITLIAVVVFGGPAFSPTSVEAKVQSEGSIWNTSVDDLQAVIEHQSTTALKASTTMTVPTEAITLTPLGTYLSGNTAEIVTYNAQNQWLYIVNDNLIDIVDASDPANLALIGEIDVFEYGSTATSVAYRDGLLAVAIPADPIQDPGQVVFFDAEGNFLSSVTVGALPDMLMFTPDGTKVVVANEGEPDDAYEVDPQGSVSIIDVSGTEPTVTQVSFAAFDGQEEKLRARGVRIYQGIEDNIVSADVEPEYIAVSADSSTAFVTLQENNAFGVIDLINGAAIDILPLGYKDHSRGMPTLETYKITGLPVLGTTATTNPADDAQTTDGQEILLGGFSGLWFDGMRDGNYVFVTVPDRGPNGEPTDVDGDGGDERPFALPDYQAQVIWFELNPDTGEITLADPILLTQPDGQTPITGLPNIAGVDEEPVDLFGNLLDYDPLGADMEGIIVAEDGSYWMVDEYRPAIYHFDEAGVLINRFVPEGTAAFANPPQPAGTYGDETLPAEYANRRRNRGFAAMALDTDNNILYAFIQTPLANPDRDASDGSDVIRMVGIDPGTGQPVAEYVYLLERPAHRTANVDKIGDAVYAGNGQFYVIERDSATDSAAKKPIFKINLTGATNLLNGHVSLLEGKTLEQHTADELVGVGVNPVHKTKVANLPSIGYLAGDKPEGLALLPDGRLAVLNDNDFGLLDAALPVDGTIPINPDPTPITLGFISFPAGNMLDASNEDGPEESGRIHIQNWPVWGMFQPDSIVSYQADGQTYYVTANEGDARDFDAYSEESRLKDEILNPETYPDAETLQEPANLGRLKTSIEFGDLDADGDVDILYSYGARSFSIWDAYGNLVYDSGDDFEHITAAHVPEIFNSNGFADDFDGRSDDKGSEPEALIIGQVGSQTYAFIGLERTGGVLVYDITNPTAPTFVTYQREPVDDMGPEGMVFVAAEDSPTEQPLLIVANEVSGSVTVHAIEQSGTQSPISRISSEDWQNTPPAVQDLLLELQELLK